MIEEKKQEVIVYRIFLIEGFEAKKKRKTGGGGSKPEMERTS